MAASPAGLLSNEISNPPRRILQRDILQHHRSCEQLRLGSDQSWPIQTESQSRITKTRDKSSDAMAIDDSGCYAYSSAGVQRLRTSLVAATFRPLCYHGDSNRKCYLDPQKTLSDLYTQPAFLFQINRMEETPGTRPRLSQHGFWLPPRTLFGSQIKEGHTTRKIFCFNGSTVTHWQGDFPEAAVLYKEMSMYHSAGHFFIVPYNATEHQVGNGRQVEKVVDSDDEEDEDAEADEEAVSDPTTLDWSVLSFHWRGEGKFDYLMLTLRVMMTTWCQGVSP